MLIILLVVFKIFKNKAIHVIFPERKLRMKSRKNWDKSIKKELVGEIQSASLDGQSAETVIHIKTAQFAADKVRRGEIELNGYYPDAKLPEDLLDLVKQSEQAKLKGKTLEEANVEELIDAGMLNQIDFSYFFKQTHKS